MSDNYRYLFNRCVTTVTKCNNEALYNKSDFNVKCTNYMKINYTLKHSAVGYVSLNIQRNKITKINGNGLNVLTCTNFGQNNTKIKPVYCGIKENTKINSPCQGNHLSECTLPSRLQCNKCKQSANIANFQVLQTDCHPHVHNAKNGMTFVSPKSQNSLRTKFSPLGTPDADRMQ